MTELTDAEIAWVKSEVELRATGAREFEWRKQGEAACPIWYQNRERQAFAEGWVNGKRAARKDASQ